MIDMASVYADRFKNNPQMLQAAVMGQSPDPKLDPYTALNALKLVKESQRMTMAGQAQQPTSSPSIVAEAMAPNPMMQGLGAMVPGAMGQMGQAAPAPQAPPMQAASGGLASLPTADEDYAAGGIVAFQEGGQLTVPPGTPYDDDETGMYADDAMGDGGTDDQRALASRNVQQSRAELMGIEDEALSRNEDQDIRQKYMDFVTKNSGPNIYDPANKRLKEREEARDKNTSQGEGLALLAAAGAILEGNTLARGAAKAFPVFAQQMGEVKRADLAEQRSIESMQFSLADAQRKERMGDIRGAQAAAETARKEKADANRFKLNKAQALAKLDADVYKAANRANKGAGAGPKWQEQVFQSNVDYLKTTQKPKEGETPEAFDARIRKQASDIVAPLLKTSFSTSENAPNKQAAAVAPVQQRVDAKVAQDIADFKLFSPEGAPYRRAVKANATQEAARLLREAEKSFRATHSRTEGLTGAGEPGTADNPIVIK